MSDLNDKTFTIRVTELSDGTIDVWSKGMPDTRTFAGQPYGDLPRSHLLGLSALNHIFKAVEVQEWHVTDELRKVLDENKD